MKLAFEQPVVTVTRNHTLIRPSLLHLVSAEEVEAMRKALAGGMAPADFESKLDRLSGRDLLHQFVAESCRSFARLLMADYTGLFHQATTAERERLLRVLAYVRKENDAIADYKPSGFQDDLQEVRAVTSEFAPLLQNFKAWRLRHQVPELWPV
jgi:hypothetical protein